MSEELESEGKTVAEAVENALKEMGLHRDQVEVQILQEATPGILGFGAKPARVKLTRKHWGAPSQPSVKAAARGERPQHGHGRRQGERGASRSRECVIPAQPPQHPAAGKSTPPGAGAPGRSHSQDRAAAAPVDSSQACAVTEEILKELLHLMLFPDASISMRWDAEQERVKVHVKTAESERLIGPGGKTLESVQFLMTLMVSRRTGSPVAVQVDTNDYWQRKENEVLSQALKGIEAVRNTGRPYRLQPMEAPMRRLIHKSLANHPDIMTASEGDGPWRKIVLRPRR